MKKILFTRFAARIDTTENQQRIYIYSCNFLSFPRRRILSQNRTVSISIRFYKQSSVPGYNFRHSKRLDIHPVKARMKGFKPDFECGTLLFSQKEANHRRFSPEASKNNCIRSLVIAYSMSSTHTHTHREKSAGIPGQGHEFHDGWRRENGSVTHSEARGTFLHGAGRTLARSKNRRKVAGIGSKPRNRPVASLLIRNPGQRIP